MADDPKAHGSTQADLVNIIRRNRTAWYLRRQLTQTVHEVKVAQQQVAAGDPALSPIGTELAGYSTEFDSAPSGFSGVNLGTSTVSYQQSRIIIVPQLGGAGVNNLRMYGPTNFIAAPWTVRTRFFNWSPVAGQGGGLAVYRAANGRIHTPQTYLRASISAGDMFTETWAVNDWSSPTTINATRFGPSTNDNRSRDRFLQVRCDGTSIYFDFSVDNAIFTNITSTTLATYLLGTGSDLRVLLIGNDPTAGSPAASVGYDWFRTYDDAALNRAPLSGG